MTTPNSYHEAVASRDAKEWKHAMQEEMKSLEDSETFTLSEIPENRMTVGGRLVYTQAWT